MGEAKRRKKLDPNYGKISKKHHKNTTKDEIENNIKLIQDQSEIENNTRFIQDESEIDESLDAIWRWTNKQGEEKISFTGKFAENLFNNFLEQQYR